MAIRPHFENYRYTTETCVAKGQSIVECRLPGNEISTILALHAHAVPIECTTADGEVRYSGKLIITVVYENSEKKVCRIERGAEFSHRVQNSAVTPASFATLRLQAENVNRRREGAGLYLSVVVGAEIHAYASTEANYLYDGEGLVVKRTPQKLVKTVICSGETEVDDEFETDYVGDVLLHSETPSVGTVSVENGQITVTGEVCLNVCALKSDLTLCSYERLVSYRIEVPCDEATEKAFAAARVGVISAHLTAGTDEEKGKCKMSVVLHLKADCEAYLEEEIPCCSDVYSPESALKIQPKTVKNRISCGTVRLTERIGGTVSLTSPVEPSAYLQAALLPRAEIVCKRTEKGNEAEGAIFADVIFSDGEDHRSTGLSLPFLFPIDLPEGTMAEAEGTVCGLSVRRKKDGETEAEATLKITLRIYREIESSFIEDVDEGEQYPKNDSAISLYLPKAGEDLWTTAKRLRCTPEDLQKNNPELTFPLKEGAKIFVYRQKTD